jgi:hypothetical protein
MMTREDYETQKQRLAEQHRSLVEMVDAAYQAQLRALDMVWRMFSGEGAPQPRAAPPPPPPAAPVAPVPKRRLKAGELKNDVAAVLPRLPEIFIFSDVYKAIGYAPDRGSLHRALHELIDEGHLHLQLRGTGTQPARFRNPYAAKEGAGS